MLPLLLTILPWIIYWIFVMTAFEQYEQLGCFVPRFVVFSDMSSSALVRIAPFMCLESETYYFSLVLSLMLSEPDTFVF